MAVELATRGASVKTALLTQSHVGINADTVDGQHAAAFLQPGNIASGAITPRAGAVNFAGGSDGQVWTVQADGSVAFEAATGGGGGLSSVSADPAPALGGTLDGNANAIIDYTQPHVASVSGTLSQASHGGRPVHATGTITTINSTGFVCEIRNKSGSAKTINKPTSGDLIHEGARKASISLPDLHSVVAAGDGTDVWIYGSLL